nr:unnamed protein product [Callosobruchus chinensis]
MRSRVPMHNPLQPSQLQIGDDQALHESHFNFSEPTVLFFHAFFESSQATPASTIRTAYLQRGDHNILLMNAQRLEAGPWYLTAARNTEIVGQYTAKFIDYLVSRGLYLPSLHLIGLSLGAQMAGVCGQNVRSGRIRRITGLDPAGPLFTKWPKSLKLDSGDAEFVDVIHTDAGIFGYPRSIGHVDFWPNGGISPQPGCTIPEVKHRSPDSILEPFTGDHTNFTQSPPLVRVPSREQCNAKTGRVIKKEGVLLTEILVRGWAFMLPKSPPMFHIQNYSLILYPVDKFKCPKVDEHRDVIFNLYTRLNPEEPQVLEIGNDELLATSNFNFNNPTVLFFHGFTESPKAGDYQAMRLSFLGQGDYNIILTNTERLLAGLYYVDAVVNCKYIGKYAAAFVDYLVHRGLNLPDLHVIGFSLGAQIAGFVGQYITSGKLSRITGLDPAGPLYNHVPPSMRLDPTDAEFVDIVHSSAALFGYKYSCGHVDFWPNGGGPKQPGCSFAERTRNGSLNELGKIIFEGIPGNLEYLLSMLG